MSCRSQLATTSVTCVYAYNPKHIANKHKRKDMRVYLFYFIYLLQSNSQDTLIPESFSDLNGDQLESGIHMFVCSYGAAVLWSAAPPLHHKSPGRHEPVGPEETSVFNRNDISLRPLPAPLLPRYPLQPAPECSIMTASRQCWFGCRGRDRNNMPVWFGSPLLIWVFWTSYCAENQRVGPGLPLYSPVHFKALCSVHILITTSSIVLSNRRRSPCLKPSMKWNLINPVNEPNSSNKYVPWTRFNKLSHYNRKNLRYNNIKIAYCYNNNGFVFQHYEKRLVTAINVSLYTVICNR